LKKFYVRTITGAVYVSIVIGSIFLGKYVFFSLFALILVFTLVEFYRMCRLKDIHTQTYTGITISIILYTALYLFGQKIISEKALLLTSLITLFVPIIEVLRKKENPIQNIAFTLTGIILISIPFAIFNLILVPYSNQPELYKPTILLGMMIIIWANDSGAYIVGSMIGKHKLAEKISPNKTWEGAIGGAIFATIIAVIYFHFFPHFNALQIILISIATVIFGTFGDLIESLIVFFMILFF